MAIFKSSTFGTISGRHGEAVAMESKLTGRNYLRLHRSPSNPRSDKQLIQRGKFAYIQRFMRSFHGVLKITMGGISGKNQGVGIALKNALQGEYPDFTVDYAQLVFSDGRVDQTGSATAEKSGTNSIKIDWESTAFSNSNDTDLVHVILYNETAGQALLLQKIAERKAGTQTLEIPAVWAGGSIYCWMYFSTADGKIKSVSQYVGDVKL
jgi:hypothetical protein